MQNCLVKAIQISLLAFILYMTVRYTDKDEEKRQNMLVLFSGNDDITLMQNTQELTIS